MDTESRVTVCAIQKSQTSENDFRTKLQTLIQAQSEDPALGDIVKMRLKDNSRPSAEKLQTESKLTKRLVVRWEKLKVRNGFMCRRKSSFRNREPDFLQLLLSRSEVQEMLKECHGGTTSGHFGLHKTKERITRRFYWSN